MRGPAGLQGGFVACCLLRGGLFLAVCLAACQPAALAARQAYPAPGDDGPLQPLATEAPPATAVVAAGQAAPLRVEAESQAGVGAEQALPDWGQPGAGAGGGGDELDPLRFSFPTPMGAAVSAWRPALYPIPWALTPFDHFFFARPIAADVVNWPLADYRYGGVFFQKIVHTGVDIPAEIGTPVLAAGSGKVTWAGYGLFTGNPEDTTDPYGMAVLIRHDFSYQDERLYTLYGHLDHLEVARGQFVSTGDLLGQSGMTGKTTGPHLHFEVRLGDGDFFQTRNPELWLVPPQGWGVLAGRVMNSGGRLLEAQLVSVRSQANRQVWRAYTYTGITVYSDTYYQENMAISDLPSGRYEVETLFEGKMYRLEIEILPGLVSYFSFRGRSGYSLELPPQPGTDFSPP